MVTPEEKQAIAALLLDKIITEGGDLVTIEMIGTIVQPESKHGMAYWRSVATYFKAAYSESIA